MKGRLTHWVLSMVFALSVVCSLVSGGMDAGRFAKKAAAPCPFHPQQKEQTDPADPSARCLNCVSSSMLREHSFEPDDHHSTGLDARIAELPHLNFNVASSHFQLPNTRLLEPEFRIDSGPPLRI